jgi:predicted extracellular nuclease
MMKLRLVVILVLILFISVSCSKSEYNEKRILTVAFYNVENLFDLEDEPGKKDEEFTPEGTKKWTAKRYQTKLDTLAKVLSSINNKELPEIIGLCEVENKKVVEDLVHSKYLKAGKYKVVHYDSPDFRGIDCALIYRPKEFKVINSFPIKVNFIDEPNYNTRDILYVKGKTKNREVFHIFVNHWPSRIGGTKKTESKRVEVAGILKSKIDSIQSKKSSAKIIVLGDMNDEPSNKSMTEILQAQHPADENTEMVNLMYPVHENKKGSYNFRGKWNMLDNIIVSSNLLDEKGFQCSDEKGYVFQEEWMQFKNKRGKISPSRTYGGPNYYGGLSDHFPVYFMLQRN